MALDYGAASRGIETGMRLGAYKDQQKMARRQEERTERAEQREIDLHDLNITMKKMQLDALQDDQVRQQTKRDLNATLHYLENVRQGGPEYLKQLQQNPQVMQQINQSIQNIGDFMVNRGTSDGRPRRFKRFVPTDQDKVMVEMEVQNPDGSTVRAPWTDRRSSDHDDPVSEFTMDQIFGDLSKVDALIDMYEAALIQQGDTGPIDRAQATRAAGLKRKHEIEDREDKQAFELEKAKITGTGRGATQGDIQLMNYFMDKGLADNQQQAYAMAQGMNTDPSKVILDIARSLHDKAPSYDKKPFSEYVRMAEGEVSALRERLQQGGSGGSDGAGTGLKVNPGDEETPPVPGAKKAPDGNWYIMKEGKWNLVEP